MYQVIKSKSFNKRSFVSVAMLVSGLLLPFSGFMNHSLQFEQLTLARHLWMSVHNVAAILFAVFAVLHVSLNWRAMVHYVIKVKDSLISREALTALAIVLFTVILISSHVFHAR